MKIEIGTLKSRIITDNPQLLETLTSLYSFDVPGSRYAYSYRKGRWDGKQRFISNGGVFHSGLLSRVLQDLKKIECEPELEYETSVDSTVYPTLDIENFTYYSYQKDLIQKALSNKRGIVKSPTGSGKTLIMAGIVKALEGRKMIILFNAKQLLKQTYEFLSETCNISNVGLCYGEGFIPGDIMLCTVQSIEKVLDTHLEEAEVLMIDECHEFANGRTTLAAIRSFPKATYRLGFTATPPREDIPTYNLEGALGPVWQVVQTKDLVDEGTLTKPIIQLIKIPYTASGVDTDMSYMDVYETFIVNNEVRNTRIKEVVNAIKKENKRARILILTKSLDHGRSLENLLGGECQFLEGSNSIGERYKAISRFRGHRGSSILIGTKILQTGINIEEITHFINARGMKSEIATLQALGRALRRHASKEQVFVYDFLDEEKYLKEHSLARKRHYTREGHEVNIL
jgi:superfamily II DNA or RNA helicase